VARGPPPSSGGLRRDKPGAAGAHLAHLMHLPALGDRGPPFGERVQLHCRPPVDSQLLAGNYVERRRCQMSACHLTLKGAVEKRETRQYSGLQRVAHQCVFTKRVKCRLDRILSLPAAGVVCHAEAGADGCPHFVARVFEGRGKARSDWPERKATQVSLGTHPRSPAATQRSGQYQRALSARNADNASPLTRQLLYLLNVP
jgi:hypothetical protein